MLSKEWRDARWKLLLGLLAFVALLATMRSYEQIKADNEFQIRQMQGELESPGEFMGPAGDAEEESFVADMRRQIQDMRSPEYVEEMARWDLLNISTGSNLVVLLALGVVLGFGLVSGEVGRGSVFLILSKPLSRTRILLTKYAVCAACLTAAAVFGGGSLLLAAYALGYPPDAVPVAQIVVSTFLAWLASLFVLGVALVASVFMRDVVSTLLATAGALFVILAGPDLIRSFVEWIVWGDRIYSMDPPDFPGWYQAFDWFSLPTYWTGREPYSGDQIFFLSTVVCVATAAVALLAALWLFRRRSF